MNQNNNFTYTVNLFLFFPLYSWDNLYTNELSNHTENPEDIGTVWFDDSDAEAKILQFLSTRTELSRADTSFLDLGSGNGSLLFSLRSSEEDSDLDDDEEEGGDEETKIQQPWTGHMLGVDYSPQSVSLARQIASTRADDLPEADKLSFQQWDLLAGPFSDVLKDTQSEGWDVALDKGTFDAISLSEETDAQGRRLCEAYHDRVLPLVKRGGLFIITSCNWTEPELRSWFESPDGQGFVLDGRVEYRSFQFGGVKGQTITTLCFRKS